MPQATMILTPKGFKTSIRVKELTAGECTIIDAKDACNRLTMELASAILTGLPIVINGVTKITPFMKELISATTFTFRAPYAYYAMPHKMPRLIFISNTCRADDFVDSRRFNVITLPAR